MQQDQRSTHRVVVELPVTLEKEDGASVVLTTKNISRTGLQVVCDQQQMRALVDEGRLTQYPELTVEIRLGERVIRTVCKMAYCHRMSQQEYNIGLKYLSVGADGIKAVDEIISAA